MTSGSSGQRGELNLAAKVVEATHEALDRLGAVAVREVVGAEILVWDAVFEHVVSGGKPGGGDREDGFLSAAAGLQAKERGLKVEPLMRTAAQAAVTRAVLSHGAPLRTRVERRLPALASLRGHKPVQEIK